MGSPGSKPSASRSPDTVAPVTITAPDYAGRGLLNLIAELERRLIGSAPAPGLAEPHHVPDAAGYVLVLFDGLGAHQLAHPRAGELAAHHVADLDAGFPTTTTTSLATLVTGTAPARHGIIGHLLYLPAVGEVVNTLKWVTATGRPVLADYASMLPAPNLFERLSGAGVEAITVQPGNFMDSPLSNMLYRGCRFEPAWTIGELIEATVQLAGPGRLVLTYFPAIDVAAHVRGQTSPAYRTALAEGGRIWQQLAARLPASVGLVGTSDHGHLDYADEDKLLIREPRFDRLRFFGDPRSTYVTGPEELIIDLAASTGATEVPPPDLRELLGPPPHHPELADRLPERLLLAPRGKLLLPRPFDKRLIGYHGGLEPEEIGIPLLARPADD
jgi:hypothetical protein